MTVQVVPFNARCSKCKEVFFIEGDCVEEGRVLDMMNLQMTEVHVAHIIRSPECEAQFHFSKETWH